MAMVRKPLFTVRELSDTLARLVTEVPELADHRILFDGLDQFADWDGTYMVSSGLGAVVLNSYNELWFDDSEGVEDAERENHCRD